MYGTEGSVMRATFGRITNPNPKGLSFCEFTNQDGVTDVEQFRLEPASCPNTDHTKLNYDAREERDPFLTNSDMTWGMSGSGLFDRNGELIGIGSNMLNNSATYDVSKNAIYVKAVHIQDLLGN